MGSGRDPTLLIDMKLMFNWSSSLSGGGRRGSCGTIKSRLTFRTSYMLPQCSVLYIYLCVGFLCVWCVDMNKALRVNRMSSLEKDFCARCDECKQKS